MSYLASVYFNHIVFGRPLLIVPSTLPCSALSIFIHLKYMSEPFVLSLVRFLHNCVC